MIVIIGPVAFEPDPHGGGGVVGLAAETAVAAATAGASVELVAKIGEDGAGEELLLALARGGVGHLAVLRDPARPTTLVPSTAPAADADLSVEPPIAELLAEPDASAPAGGGPGGAESGPNGRVPAPAPGLPLEPADLSLGLRYLREYQVVVAVEPLAAGAAAVVADAASFADAALVVLAAPGTPLPDAYASAIVLEAPPEDPDGAFSALAGRFAAALDRGEPADDALRAAVAAGGWEPAGA